MCITDCCWLKPPNPEVSTFRHLRFRLEQKECVCVCSLAQPFSDSSMQSPRPAHSDMLGDSVFTGSTIQGLKHAVSEACTLTVSEASRVLGVHWLNNSRTQAFSLRGLHIQTCSVTWCSLAQQFKDSGIQSPRPLGGSVFIGSTIQRLKHSVSEACTLRHAR